MCPGGISRAGIPRIPLAVAPLICSLLRSSPLQSRPPLDMWSSVLVAARSRLVRRVPKGGATLPFVIDRLRAVLEVDPRITYALVFGSRGRRSAHRGSDVDVAIGLAPGSRLSAREVGDLVSRLETVAGSPVDLVILDEAGPGVAYRAFRDGRPVITRDARALTERRARAILEYLDWKPIEKEFTRAALEASQRG
jgi:predicted nucleotidyltransferase